MIRDITISPILKRVLARLAVEQHPELADWWSDLGPDGQETYISNHPNSDKAKNAKEKEQKKAEKEAPKEKKEPKKEDKKESRKENEEEKPAKKEKQEEQVTKKDLKETPETKKELKKEDQKEEKTFDSNKKPDDEHSPIKKVDKQEREKVVVMLDKLKEMTEHAVKKGEKAPDFDLCKVSVPGTNLFCGVNKGIPRAKMPQLKGNPVKGTPAAKLPKNDKGEVDAEDAFKVSLINKGVKMEPKKVDASKLKSTQSQLVGAKVAGMVSALKDDPNHKAIRAPIFVSKDGYILDGHHRWAAVVGLSLVKDHPIDMNVVQVDMTAEELVDYTNNFANEIGIEQKGA